MIKKATVLSEISSFTLNSPSNVCLVATFYKMFDKTIPTQGFLTVCVHIGLFCSSSFTSKANVQCQSSKKLVNGLFCQTDEPKESISRFPKFVIFIWFWVNWPFKKMSCCPVLLLLFFFNQLFASCKEILNILWEKFHQQGATWCLHVSWPISASHRLNIIVIITIIIIRKRCIKISFTLCFFFFRRMYRVWLTQSEFILESLTGFMSVC